MRAREYNVLCCVREMLQVSVRITSLIVVLALAACGGAKKSAAPMNAPAPEPSAAGAPMMPDDPKQQIRDLEAQMDGWRNDLQLAEPAPNIAPSPTPFYAPAETDPKCKPAKTERCTNSCKLSDQICGNAKKICDIAQSLQGDNWAADRCTRANKTCDAAHAKCCGCQ